VISRIRAFWNNLFRRKQLDRDFDDELQAYVELLANERVKDGADPDKAYLSARREAGALAHVRENVRDVRVGVSLGRLAQDIRYGGRTLAKNPAFTLVAITTLALGIGANTAMFSLLDQVVLRLLPVPHPEQLVIVRETGNHYGNSYGPNTVSWPMFEDLRDANQVFSGMFCRFPATVTLGYADRAAQISAELVSGSYFPTLGIGAVLGRTIAPGDDAVPDSEPVVVLSYSFWRSYFLGDRTIVGRTIALNGHAMTVIGVAQPGFDGVELGGPVKVFVPIMLKTEMTPHSDGLKDRRRRLSWVTTYGRLKSGVSLPQAQLRFSRCCTAFSNSRYSSPNSSGHTPLRIGSCFFAIALSSSQALRTSCARTCGGRSGSWSRSPERCFFLPVPTWPIFCWRAPRRASGNSPFVSPSVRAAPESFASFWSRACFYPSPAPHWG
jgi:hypothetical protein